MKDLKKAIRLTATLSLLVLLLPFMFDFEPAAGVQESDNHYLIGTITFQGDAVEGADVHVISSMGEWNFTTSTYGTFEGWIGVSYTGDIVTVTASHPIYGQGEFSYLPTTYGFEVNIGLQPPTTIVTTIPTTTTITTETPGTAHHVTGMVTCQGTKLNDAIVFVTSSMGVWEFNTNNSGIYQGWISISVLDDIITVTATHPECGTGQITAEPNDASSTRIDIDIMPPVTTVTTAPATTVTTTAVMPGFPHSVYGKITSIGDGLGGASVHIATSTGAWDVKSLAGGVYGYSVMIIDFNDTITVTATFTGYESAEGSSAPMGSATEINLDLVPKGTPVGLPHSVMGMVTSSGTQLSGASIHVTTSLGAWDFTTFLGGIYGGTITISGISDTITVSATYPGYMSAEASSRPTGSNTQVNLELVKLGGTQQGLPHSVYGQVTCDGDGLSGASVIIETGIDTLVCTSGEDGIYGGTLTISGAGDTITVSATQPACGTAEVTTAPTGSDTHVDVNIEQDHNSLPDYFQGLSFNSVFSGNFMTVLYQGLMSSLSLNT